jgi:hypothetical protein
LVEIQLLSQLAAVAVIAIVVVVVVVGEVRACSKGREELLAASAVVATDQMGMMVRTPSDSVANFQSTDFLMVGFVTIVVADFALAVVVVGVVGVVAVVAVGAVVVVVVVVVEEREG